MKISVRLHGKNTRYELLNVRARKANWPLNIGDPCLLPIPWRAAVPPTIFSAETTWSEFQAVRTSRERSSALHALGKGQDHLAKHHQETGQLSVVEGLLRGALVKAFLHYTGQWRLAR